MGLVKQWLLEQYEDEIAEQYCPECGNAYNLDVEEGGCYCAWVGPEEEWEEPEEDPEADYWDSLDEGDA